VLPMGPMLIPQVIRIDTRNDQARNRHTVQGQLALLFYTSPLSGVSLDGKLAPKICHATSQLLSPSQQELIEHKPEVAAA
jgi:hypothetical protein